MRLKSAFAWHAPHLCLHIFLIARLYRFFRIGVNKTDEVLISDAENEEKKYLVPLADSQADKESFYQRIELSGNFLENKQKHPVKVTLST